MMYHVIQNDEGNTGDGNEVEGGDEDTGKGSNVKDEGYTEKEVGQEDPKETE